MTVLVIGEALVDVVGGVAHVGGSPLNVSVGLSRLGQTTRLLTRYGADEWGGQIDAQLQANDVAVLQGSDAQRTSSAVVTLDDAGVPSYDFDINWQIDALHAAQSIDADTRVVHTGSIATVLQPGAEVVRELVRSARGRALVTFDPNCRPTVVPDRELAVAQAEAFVALADVVKASDEDLEWLYPDRTVEQTLSAWVKMGVTLVIVTRGGSGASAVTRHVTASVPGIAVKVADTVGAGDSFMAALIDGLLQRVPADADAASARESIKALNAAELERLLSYCARAAAITVSRPGADPPSRAELDATTT